jgi:hypothetical protein
MMETFPGEEAAKPAKNLACGSIVYCLAPGATVAAKTEESHGTPKTPRNVFTAYTRLVPVDCHPTEILRILNY